MSEDELMAPKPPRKQVRKPLTEQQREARRIYQRAVRRAHQRNGFTTAGKKRKIPLRRLPRMSRTPPLAQKIGREFVVVIVESERVRLIDLRRNPLRE